MKKLLTIIAGAIFLVALLFYSQAFGESLVSKDTSGVYELQAGEEEIVAARTRTAKKFSTDQPGHFRVAIGQPIHYKLDPFPSIAIDDEAEQYKEIDLTVSLTPGEDWDAACESNGYQVRFWQSREIAGKTIRYIAQFRRAGKWLAMAPLALIWENDAGQRELISKPVAGITPVIDNDAYRVTWIDCFGSGIHYRYNLRPDEFFKTVIVQDKTDLPAPTIPGPGLKLTIVLGVSWHNQSKAANGFASGITPDVLPNDSDTSSIDEELVNPDVFAYRDELFRDTFWVQRPKAWDSADEVNSINVEWRLRRRGNYIFVTLSVPATVLNNPSVVYPVYIDTDITEEQVSATSYDGYSAGTASVTDGSSNVFTTQNAIDVGYLAPNYFQSGAIFTTIPIPKDSVINSASLKLYNNNPGPGGGDGSPYFFKITAEDTSNPGVWASGHRPGIGGAPGRAAETTAQVDWDRGVAFVTNTWYTTPDISVVTQELVNQSAWVSGNAMAYIVRGDNGTSSSYADFDDYTASSSQAAKLNINFTFDVIQSGFEQKPELGTPIDWSHPQTDGLVAWWHFMEGGGNIVYDLTDEIRGDLNGFDFPATATSGWIPGRAGAVLRFDGTDDYINAGIEPFEFGTDPFSITLWVKTASFGPILLKYDLADPTLPYYAMNMGPTGVFDLEMRDAGSNASAVVSNTSIDDNHYHFLAVVRDVANDVLKLYLDGIEDATPGADNTGSTDNGDPIQIGAYVRNGQYFPGIIDDVRIYDRALSQQEIQDVMNNPNDPFLEPLLFEAKASDPPPAQVIIINEP